jgi:hypothetical protein
MEKYEKPKAEEITVEEQKRIEITANIAAHLASHIAAHLVAHVPYVTAHVPHIDVQNVANTAAHLAANMVLGKKTKKKNK